MKILDRIHTETRTIPTSNLKDPKNDKEISVEKLWKYHLAKHNSVTSRIFEGLQRVSTFCSGCKKTATKHEVFS